MKRVPTGLLVATLAAMTTGCSGWDSHGSNGTGPNPAIKTLHLKPGHYVFHLGGRVDVGDRILCVTRSGASAGGGFVPSAGHGVGSSTGFSVFTHTSGKVKITCPANPGNG